jgi:hypothetical protein
MSSLFTRGLGPQGLVQEYWASRMTGAPCALSETVTLSNRGPNDTWATVTANITAVRRIFTGKDIEVRDGRAQVGDMRFRLWQQTMNGATPSPHDLITDANSNQYFIAEAALQVDTATGGGAWVCEIAQGK